jgi:hypothetical protein
MANTFLKLPLSASVDGKRILIVGTGSGVATSIHTATSDPSSTDEVWLYAYNDSTSSLSCTVMWGGTTEPDDVSRISLASQAGRILIIDGQLIQNGLIVKAYAQVPNKVTVDGFINRITTVT